MKLMLFDSPKDLDDPRIASDFEMDERDNKGRE